MADVALTGEVKVHFPILRQGEPEDDVFRVHLASDMSGGKRNRDGAKQSSTV